MSKTTLAIALVLVVAAIFFRPLIAWAQSSTDRSTDQSISDEDAMQIVRNHQGRVELAKLLKAFESGEIDAAEYEKRIKEIKAKYLEKAPMPKPPPNPCEGVTCATKGKCEVVDGRAKCTSCEHGYVSDYSNGPNCVPAPPSPGWSRQAAILGLAATPVSVILGMSAFGATVLHNSKASLSFRTADLTLVGLLGPAIAAGAGSAQDSASVIGVPLSRVAAHATYSIGAIGGLVDTLLYEQNSNRAEWPVLVWGSAGAASLLLHSIDASVSYHQSTGGDTGAKKKGKKRPWMWTALVAGAAATAGAVVTGAVAKKKFDKVGRVSVAETLCEGTVISGEGQRCGVEGPVQNARRWTVATDILVGIAATGFVTGGVLYFVEPLLRCPSFLGGVSLAPYAVPSGAGLALGGRF